ncbi:MAG: hypothetical protein OCD03_09410 [Hyphomicrobiales bacterium]
MLSETYLLLSAARKYCMEQHTHWCSVYAPIAERHGIDYTDESYDTFPRYNTLNTILNEVEKIDGDNLPSFSVLKKLIAKAGKNATSDMIQSPSNEIEAAAIGDEKTKFVQYIENLTEEEIKAIEPLPYMRLLTQKEVGKIWKKMARLWGCEQGQYWYPLADKSEPSLFAFDVSVFDKNFSPEILQNILQSWNIERLYELREHGDENYYLSRELWEPYYNGAEGFWVSEDLDWIMYASHENTITVGGRLKEELLRLCPNEKEFKL